MKQTKLAVLVSALLCSAAVGTASAPAIAADEPVAVLTASVPGLTLAKNGADDPLPQPCDDAGTDLCVSGGQVLAKNGADDPLPQPCDDAGTDLCVSGGQILAKNGADDPLPQPCDDHGTDVCLIRT